MLIDRIAKLLELYSQILAIGLGLHNSLRDGETQTLIAFDNGSWQRRLY